MGRRKERRLAAKSNAGRRVKLDLFAEPSGDLGGSSAQDEVEEDSKRDDGLPNSPSSSGQQPQNPLLLLGQYSDDETDKDPSRSIDNASRENMLADDDDQVKQLHKRGYEGEGVAEDVAVQNLREDVEKKISDSHHLEGLEGRGIEESHACALDNLHEEVTEGDPQCDAKNSSALVQDVFAGWKMVMHEDTNQYYYWNVDTGETSWDVPAILAQITEVSKDQMYSATVTTEDQPPGTHESDSVPGFNVEVNAVSAGLMLNGSVDARLASPEKKSDHSIAAVSKLIAEQENATYKDSYLDNDVENCIPSSKSTLDSRLLAGRSDSVEGIEQSSQLITQSESLLERLKSLQSATDILHGHDWISKYILEIQIRLSDMRSLSSYGSILGPFWVHSEKQLQQLESAVKGEIFQYSKREPDDATKEMDVSLARENGSIIDCKEPEFEVNQINSVPVVAKAESGSVSPEVEIPSNADQTAAYHIKDGDTDHLASDIEEGELIDSAILSEASTLKPAHNAVVDIDMDVDMEVEDLTPADSSTLLCTGGTKTSSASEKLGEPNLLPECPVPFSEDGTSVPPPPDEEWIPPPPPDGEQIPPPPPDEPCPPVPADTLGHPLPYADHYTYPNSSYVYGHGDMTGINFYEQAAGGGQVALEHGSVLFGALPHAYADTVTVVAPAETVSYYNLQNEVGPPASGVNTVEASQFQCVSGSSSYGSLSSSEIHSVPALTQGGSAMFPQTDLNTERVTADTPSTSAIMSATIRASATTSAKETVPVTSSTSASVVTSTASIDAKTQSKVVRSKKRTLAIAPTLRSNKKVSSLVNKWKAAKEELKEDEENEEKNALAILERKRQKEIEEWHAQQIASGEAKDNANFQPLGGDWRERVKRRRTQAAAEAVQSQEGTTGGTQQKPNLVELGRGLPSGWQAYWDESSKQVYYGNLITSETTWTRPTKS